MARDEQLSHKRVLLAASDIRISVSRYSPRERHSRHTDRCSRASLLVAGGYREEGRSGPMAVRPGDILLKSRRAPHENEFGASGAMIASIEFLDGDPFDEPPYRGLHRRADADALRHLSAVLEAARADDVCSARAAAVDMVAATAADDMHRRAAPPWLDQLGEELEERGLAALDVGLRARSAGAHPAHASRLFRQCYGRSMTDHARVHAVRRAMSDLATRDVSLSDAALAAGFYDQSHMCRAFRRVLGRTPGAQRALLSSILGEDRPIRGRTAGSGWSGWNGAHF
jgi:AraC-like DNA-binding protein